MTAITLLVADSQLLFADALAVSLNFRPEFLVLEDRPVSGPAAIESILKHSPDVALIDYWINGMEGPALVRSVLAKAPERKLIILAWFLSPYQVQKALNAGATAYVPKNRDVREVAEIIREAHARRSPAGPASTSSRASAKSRVTAVEPEPLETEHDFGEPVRVLAGLASLTPREIEILRRLRLEGRADTLAAEFGITKATMRNHIYNITSKTGTRSHVEAVALARRYGFI